jgi:prepilin-type N-terminal cleavage/methylation domain-containing protein
VVILKRIKSFFTLIELITVIVVLGILAAIVIPNISSIKEDGKVAAIKSDARNIQTAVDMYGLDFHGATPTKEKATFGNPQIVELYGLEPEYLRNIPKNNGAKFWLDENNTVWASMVDAPTKVIYDDGGGKLTWETVDGAELYKVYKTSGELTSSTKGSEKMEFLEVVKPINSETQSVDLPTLSKETYLVTAIDIFDFESAPTKEGTTYQGYGEGPSKDFIVNNSLNNKPIAIISMSPDVNVGL